MELRKRRQRVDLRLEEEVSALEAAELRELAIAALDLGKPIVIEWSDAARIDGSALQVLLALRAEAERRNRPLSVTEPSEAVASLLALAGAAELFEPASAAVSKSARSSTKTSTPPETEAE